MHTQNNNIFGQRKNAQRKPEITYERINYLQHHKSHKIKRTRSKTHKIIPHVGKPEPSFVGGMDPPVVLSEHACVFTFTVSRGWGVGTKFGLPGTSFVLSWPRRRIAALSPRWSWTTLPERTVPVGLKGMESLTITSMQFVVIVCLTSPAVYVKKDGGLLLTLGVVTISITSPPGRVISETN